MTLTSNSLNLLDLATPGQGSGQDSNASYFRLVLARARTKFDTFESKEPIVEVFGRLEGFEPGHCGRSWSP